MESELESETMRALREGFRVIEVALRSKYRGLFALTMHEQRDWMNQKELEWKKCLLGSVQKERKALQSQIERERAAFEEEKKEWQKEREEWIKEKEQQGGKEEIGAEGFQALESQEKEAQEQREIQVKEE